MPSLFFTPSASLSTPMPAHPDASLSQRSSATVPWYVNAYAYSPRALHTTPPLPCATCFFSIDSTTGSPRIQVSPHTFPFELKMGAAALQDALGLKKLGQWRAALGLLTNTLPPQWSSYHLSAVACA